ncbi:MAG: fibronectin type III domain-containing protein [Treponema sp.]|nr:fibronectin type III domain-containing protein [Treponema sp.]
MKNKSKFFGIIAIGAMIGLSVMACDQANDPGSSQWTVTLIQNHTATDNTTVASFIHTNGNQFPANVATPSVRSGWTFTGYWTARSDGTQYFGADGVRTAAAGDPQTLNDGLRLYAQWSQDEVQQPGNITWTASAYGSPTTTAINFTFSANPTELLASDITIASAGGSATRGALTGTGTTRSLAVTGVSAGTVSVSINRDGIASGPQSVTLVAAADPPSPVNITWTAAAYGDPTTTAINFTFSANPTGLLAADITIASAGGSATRGALTGTGTTRSLAVTDVSAGTVSVSINRDGIASGPQTVTLIIQVPPPAQPDISTVIDLGPIPGIAASGPPVFTLGTTYGGEFVELRMSGRSADWHAMDIQFPELITAGYLTASGTYTVRVAGRSENSAAGVFMIQGIQPGHSWGTTVPLTANVPFTHSRDFTMQSGPQPWVGDSRWAGARLTTDGAGENADIIFTSIEIVRVAGNVVVWNLADAVTDDTDPTPPQLTGTVSITGTTQVGNTLTADTANLGGSGTISFQWMAGANNVGTGNTLNLTTAHSGQMITVTVTRANNSGSVTSPAVGPITDGVDPTPPQLTGTVSITGTTQVGNTLTADTANLGGSGTISFQWMAGANNVGTGNTLNLTAAHSGQMITVTVTRANNSGSVTSPAVGPVTAAPQPPLTGTISIIGTPQVGQTLSVNTNNLGGTGTISFQWRAGNFNIGTNSTVTLQSIDVGDLITVTVTRANNSGSITSPAVGPVTPAPQPPLTGTVSITGTPQVGQTLSVNTIGLGGSGTISFQWRRGTTNIAGATGSTRTLVAADQGANISVVVTRANNSGSVTSPSVGPVTAAVTIPSAPTGVTATATSHSAIQISWNAVSGATSYRVEVRTTSFGTWSTLTTVLGTSHTHTGLPANTQRWYRVFAINSAGTSSASSIVNATTAQAPFGLQEAHAAFLLAGGSAYASVFPIGSFTWNASNNTLSFASNAPGTGAAGIRGFEATTGSPPSSMLFFIEMEVVFNANRQITTVRHRYVIIHAFAITGLNPSHPTSANPHRTAWFSIGTTVGDNIIRPGLVLTRTVGQVIGFPWISGNWRRTN